MEQQARLIGISDVVSKSDPFSVLLAKHATCTIAQLPEQKRAGS